MNSLLALAVILLNSLPPGLPCHWYGTANVPAGTLIEAWGTEGCYATTATFDYPGFGVVYTIDVPADDMSTPEREGAIGGEGIAFRLIDPAWPPTVIGWAEEVDWWRTGTSSELNLHVEGGAPATPTPTATSHLRLFIAAPIWEAEGRQGRIEICAIYGAERICVTVWLERPPWSY